MKLHIGLHRGANIDFCYFTLNLFLKCWKTNEIGQPSYEQLGTGLFEVWVVRAHVDINERAIVKTRLSKVYEISESGFKRNWKVKKILMKDIKCDLHAFIKMAFWDQLLLLVVYVRPLVRLCLTLSENNLETTGKAYVILWLDFHNPGWATKTNVIQDRS